MKQFIPNDGTGTRFPADFFFLSSAGGCGHLSPVQQHSPSCHIHCRVCALLLQAQPICTSVAKSLALRFFLRQGVLLEESGREEVPIDYD